MNQKKADLNDLKNKEIENLKQILEDHHIKFSLEKEVLVKNLVLKAAEHDKTTDKLKRTELSHAVESAEKK